MAPSFSSLSADIRAKIYELLVVVNLENEIALIGYDQNLESFLMPDAFRGKSLTPEQSKALTRHKLPICFQVLYLDKTAYYEATQLLYSRNKFSFPRLETLTVFIDQIGSRNANFLRHLMFPGLCASAQTIIRGYPPRVRFDNFKLSDRTIRVFEVLGAACSGLARLDVTLLLAVRPQHLTVWRIKDESMAKELVREDGCIMAMPSLEDLNILVKLAASDLAPTVYLAPGE